MRKARVRIGSEGGCDETLRAPRAVTAISRGACSHDDVSGPAAAAAAARAPIFRRPPLRAAKTRRGPAITATRSAGAAAPQGGLRRGRSTRRPVSFDPARGRVVVLMTRFVRHRGSKFRSAPLPKHVAYLKREGVTRDGADARMFDRQSYDADTTAFAERCDDDRHHLIWAPNSTGSPSITGTPTSRTFLCWCAGARTTVLISLKSLTFTARAPAGTDRRCVEKSNPTNHLRPTDGRRFYLAVRWSDSRPPTFQRSKVRHSPPASDRARPASWLPISMRDAD